MAYSAASHKTDAMPTKIRGMYEFIYQIARHNTTKVLPLTSQTKLTLTITLTLTNTVTLKKPGQQTVQHHMLLWLSEDALIRIKK